MLNPTRASLALLLAVLAARAATAMTVVVTADKANLMVGTKIVATVTKGQELVVTQQRDVWYGVRVRSGGKVVFGWLHSRDCEPKKALTKKGEDPLEIEAQKELERRKAQAEKLAAEKKLDEAVALFDNFPQRYWKTKAGKQARDLGGKYDDMRRASPQNLEPEAQKELERRKAQADKLAQEGKLDEAIRLMQDFPGSYEKTKAYQEAKKYALDLQAKANVSMADFEKKILELVAADKFDEALAEVKALEEKKLPGKEEYLKHARAFVELQKAAAASPDAPVSSDDGVADVYAKDPELSRLGSRLLNIRGPKGVTTIKVPTRRGDKIVIVQVQLPKPADQIAHGEKLLHVFPWSPNVRYYLAKLYARAGQTDKAVATYAQVRLLDRGRSVLTLDSYLEAARVLARARRYDEAVALLEKSLERKADDFIALAELGRVHLAAGRKAKAAAALEKSLKLHPSQPKAVRLLAEARGRKPPEPRFAKLQLTELVKKVEESCVIVAARKSSGSGFVIDAAGLVATNFHVIAPGGKLSVRYKRQGKFVSIPDVQLVLGDPVSDIAILKVNAREFPLKPLPLGSANDVATAEDIVVIGNPGLGHRILDYTVTKGIISNRDRLMNNLHYFQTDAAINPGNSGGPLFNMKGQVVGMVTLKATIERTGFALHIDHVKAHFPHCFPDLE